MDRTDVLDFIGSLSEDSLEHVYDPKKAHDYYLKNRDLKGRKRGAVPYKAAPTSSPHIKPIGKPRPAAKKVVPRQTPAQAKAAAHKAHVAKVKKEAEARVAHLQARLDQLKNMLAELTKQAKLRSGVHTETKKSTDKKDVKPKTAQEKREAAKSAKEYREKQQKKEGDPSLSDQAKQIEKKIAEVKEKISDMKKQIAEARKKAQTRKKPDANPKPTNGIKRPLKHSEEGEESKWEM